MIKDGNGLELRGYKPEDLPVLEKLFYETVHGICGKDYTEEQLYAWADGQPHGAAWNESFLAHDTVVAVLDGQVVGFGDLDREYSENGVYLDRLYVHKDYQNQGIATAITDWAEQHASWQCAKAKQPITITVHASVTARPFLKSAAIVWSRSSRLREKAYC